MIDPITAWTSIGVLLIVIASLWALRSKRSGTGVRPGAAGILGHD